MAIFILYGVISGLLGGLLLVSVLTELFSSNAVAGNQPPDVAGCARDVGTLLDDLDHTAASLQQDAIHVPAGDLATRWDTFSRDWQTRWLAVGARCRFQSLAGSGLGTAYDRVAEVHHQLGTTRLKYRDLMARFSRDLADELGEMRRALDRSLADAVNATSGKAGATNPGQTQRPRPSNPPPRRRPATPQPLLAPSTK